MVPFHLDRLSGHLRLWSALMCELTVVLFLFPGHATRMCLIHLVLIYP
jgi:hypothetical protein